ncbi:MAG: DUF3793 family protein [Anaerocolumna sp.]
MSHDILNIKDNSTSSYVCFIFANSCMPTLMKAKPSTLVSFHKKYIEDKLKFFKVLKEETRQFQCQYKLLCESDKMYYILVYNPEQLEEIFNKFTDNQVLKKAGYMFGDDLFYWNLYHFKKRYRSFVLKISDFPHELGILLGYPIKDVEAYIENNGENYLLCGFWKVYHNVDEAGRIFEYFKNLRDEAVNLLMSGRELKDILPSAS